MNIPTYKEAALQARKAQAMCLASLVNENWVDGTPVQDEDGHWMTKEEVVTRLAEDYRR